MASHSSEFRTLSAWLREGLALSGQRSYERRLPEAAALPMLREARRGLRALVRKETTAGVWRSLALAEEALLHYPAAVEALQRTVALSRPPDRKDLKKLAQLKAYAAKWEALGLTPEALADLGSCLDVALRSEPCDRSHRHTRAWLELRGVASVGEVIESLQAAGGFCDCEVLLNVV